VDGSQPILCFFFHPPFWSHFLLVFHPSRFLDLVNCLPEIVKTVYSLVLGCSFSNSMLPEQTSTCSSQQLAALEERVENVLCWLFFFLDFCSKGKHARRLLT
jgi:hypothetical protein